jgi:hypothetical protein
MSLPLLPPNDAKCAASGTGQTPLNVAEYEVRILEPHIWDNLMTTSRIAADDAHNSKLCICSTFCALFVSYFLHFHFEYSNF